MHAYRHSGLTVASDIELPEWEAFATEPSDTPDVRIVVARDTTFPDLGDRLQVEGERVRFAIAGVGGWSIEKGSAIVLSPARGAKPEELRLFTLGSAWGMLGYQRGDAMWHASAVRLGGRTALFCGRAGEGKSTMAAAMVAAGARLVADDLSRIVIHENGPVIYPSATRLKLWGEAVDQLGWRDRVLRRDWRGEDKFLCSMDAHAAGTGPWPLDLIVVLATGNEHRVETLVGGEAVKAALKGTIYRPEVLTDMDQWNVQAVLAARIVAGCTVVRLTRPRDLDALDRSVERVKACLGSLG